MLESALPPSDLRAIRSLAFEARGGMLRNVTARETAKAQGEALWGSI